MGLAASLGLGVFHHEERTIYGNIEETLRNVKWAVQAWVLQMDKYPKYINNLVTKWLNDKKVNVLRWL